MPEGSRNNDGYDSTAAWGVFDPLEGYTDTEKRWIREYDRLLREQTDRPRRRALRHVMAKKRREIWHIAQPESEGGDGRGWGYGRRRARYASLFARTQ